MTGRIYLKACLIMSIFLLGMVCTTSAGSTIYVDDDGPADFNNIQAAIDDANDGDTIIVADGIYTGQGNRDISVIDKVITLRSENGPDNCIIDCNGSEFDGHSGFYFFNCDDSNTVLDGFTITNAYRGGAPIWCDDSSPTIINCNIRGNRAFDAGGIYVDRHSSPRIINCNINENSSGLAGGIGSFGNPMIINCNIIGNVDRIGDEGGMQFYMNSSATVANCIIRDNSEKQIATSPGAHVSVSYSNVQGSWGGEGNIDADPCFAFGSDYHLMPDSPCIDAGTNSPPGGLPTHDPDGNARPLDGDGDTNSIADIGVHEFNAQEPLIAVSPKWMELPIARGGTYPNDQILSIRNCGGGTLVWQITEDCPWVEVSSTNGESTGEIDDIILSIYASGLPIGKYYCQLRITADGALNSPIMVEVTVDVHPGVLHVPSEYATIQSAIDSAVDGNEIVVSCGTYYENINFGGKNIILRSTEPTNPSVVTNTIIDGNNVSSVVTFSGTESPACVLSGFTITNGKYPSMGGGGIYGGNWEGIGTLATIQYNIISGNRARRGSFPSRGLGGGLYNCDGTIQYNIISANMARGNEAPGYGGGLCNCDGTIRDNVISNNWTAGWHHYGGGLSNCNGTIQNNTVFGNSAEYGGGLSDCNDTIRNCIIWQNTADEGAQLYACSTPSYSCIQDWTGGGTGNIGTDPCFADADANDYHLKSQAGRWDPNSQSWIIDANTSPCIDAGDMASPIGYEPFPNGGVINMGAYGGTAEASKSYFGLPVCEIIVAGDINGDCKVNFLDFALMAFHWLEER